MIAETSELTRSEQRRIVSNTERILELLKSGPQLSSDLIDVTHRFSACIRNLREQGYTIEVEKLESGLSVHSLHGYVERVKVTEELQEAYYHTRHWHICRTLRLKHDGFQATNRE